MDRHVLSPALELAQAYPLPLVLSVYVNWGPEVLKLHCYVRRMGLYSSVALLAALVFLPGIRSYFVADDWPIMARSTTVSLQHVQRLFIPVQYGWYRPLFELFIALCWQLFGLSPTGYHLIVFLLYVLTSALVGNLAELLTGEQRVGVLSSALFAVHGSHVEPVLWIASSNEVLAGLFAILSMTSYIVFRRSNKLRWLLVAWLFFLMGIFSKETAVFLPLMIVIHDLWLYQPATRHFTWHTTISPNVLFVLTGLSFTVFRLFTGSPYSTSVGFLRIGINFAYYVAVEVFALPDNYGYLTALPLWRQEPLLPIFTVSLATGGLGLLGWLSWGSRSVENHQSYSSALRFTISWSVLALSPVFLTATGRTAFLSSMGIAWTIAILFTIVWQNFSTTSDKKKLLMVALSLLISANLLVSSYRTYWWREAGETSRATLLSLNDQLKEVPTASEVWLIGLPDHLKHAYTFRNAFPAINKLLYPDWNMHVILDTEMESSSKPSVFARVREQAGKSPDIAIFWYEKGVLRRPQD